MDSLTDFVVNGKIGRFFLGQSKDNILEVFGEPKSWVGKPPCFGEAYESYTQSDVWHYYEGIVAARFDNNETITELILFVDHIKESSEIFAGWPGMHGITMREWRSTLEQHGLQFTESQDDLNYWILSGPTCIACCWPYPGGKPMPRLQRPVVMIKKVLDPRKLTDIIEEGST